MIRVLLAASSPVARAGLESVLNGADGIEVARTIAGWEELASEDADVIVAEWDGAAPDVRHELSDTGPHPPVVLLVSDPRSALTAELLRWGVRGVLAREASPDQIVAAVRAAAAGLAAFTTPDFGPWPQHPQPEVLTEDLTARETEVLRMVAEGLSNKLIAHRLGISEHTVKFHLTSIMSKLGAASRTEAVTIGVRRGLILL